MGRKTEEESAVDEAPGASLPTEEVLAAPANEATAVATVAELGQELPNGRNDSALAPAVLVSRSLILSALLISDAIRSLKTDAS